MGQGLGACTAPEVRCAAAELVRCRAFVRVTRIDPQEGVFEVRMKCLWSFRTRNSGEQAEITMRGVPGIRMPGLRVTVEESRIWKDLNFDNSEAMGLSRSGPSKNTLFWRGTSIFTMSGWKAFDLINFPFDRHILNLERVEFVWRSDKDSADYHKSLKVVQFTTETSSMLPEWETYHALVEPLVVHDTKLERTIDHVGAMKIPTYATKFSVRLRIERKCRFYSWQVFFVVYLITMLSCFPLGMPPQENFLGDRLNMYAAGVLTLVAYKTGINDHLPNVPYQTFTDWYLLAAIMTLFFAAVGTLYPYRLSQVVDDKEEYDMRYQILDCAENVTAGLLFVVWTLVVVWVFFVKPGRRTPWDSIMQADTDAFGRDDAHSLEEDEEEPRALHHLDGSSVTKDFQHLMQTRALVPKLRRQKPLLEWDRDEVAHFLRTLQLGHCVEKLAEEVDGCTLAALSEQQLLDRGFTALQAKKVATRVREAGRC
ncbi:unnamed protein product [Prorocentrum cordatum]|uniref:SAM domain-containing protein n=1 Tax=Prorocentrum cordatum TaxID=2364126 RepID=A0ABN9SQW3_9DINO|nr:unnamed protein product [Polarella glacialis]